MQQREHNTKSVSIHSSQAGQPSDGEKLAMSRFAPDPSTRNLQKMADYSPQVRQLRTVQQFVSAQRSQPPLQLMALGAVSERHLWGKLRMEGNVRDFENVKMFTCTGVQYKGTPQNDVAGITFPHESPPHVYLNLTNIPDNDTLASTIYHEVTHAYDPETPGKQDDTREAKDQDMFNEMNTWRKEIEYSIRTGGHDLERNITDGYVIRSNEGEYVPDPERFSPEALREAGYGGYDTETRPDRFNLANYTFAAGQAFSPFGTKDDKEGFERAIHRQESAQEHGNNPMSEAAESMYG